MTPSALLSLSLYRSLPLPLTSLHFAQGGCVGGGEGTILVEGDLMYELIEAPDLTLGCLTKPGVQNWVLGLLRSHTFGERERLREKRKVTSLIAAS